MLNVAIDMTAEIALEAEKKTALAQAKDLKIITVDDYLAAKSFWGSVKLLRDKISKTFQPMIDQAHRLHKEAIARRDEHDLPLKDAEKTIKKAMADYEFEQAEIRRKETARLAEAARKQEEDRRLAQAAELEAMGKADLADQVLDAPFKTVAPSIPAPARVKGDPIFRTVWKFRIVDPNLVPREYLKIDDIKIGGVVRALKDATNIPGVEVFSERV